MMLVAELEGNRSRLEKLRRALERQHATAGRTHAAFVLFRDREAQERCLEERHRRSPPGPGPPRDSVRKGRMGGLRPPDQPAPG